LKRISGEFSEAAVVRQYVDIFERVILQRKSDE
jgi:hypothetical protein